VVEYGAEARAAPAPAFRDFTTIWDFCEEAEIASGFRMLFSLVESIDSFAPCFGRLRYRHIAF
jgi:hypothetical protein